MEFSVQVENVQWRKLRKNKVVSVTKLVAVEAYGFTLIMRNKMFGVLVSNDTRSSVELSSIYGIQ